jgi:hypothetical protein
MIQEVVIDAYCSFVVSLVLLSRLLYNVVALLLEQDAWEQQALLLLPCIILEESRHHNPCTDVRFSN